MIGLIIPPPDIKKFVEKTAEHVAQNGSEFQNMLLQREQGKTEFAFLQKESPYRAYYDHRVGEISKKLILEAQGAMEQVKQQLKEGGDVVESRQVKVEEASGVVALIPGMKVTDQSNFRDTIFEEIKEPDPPKYIAQIPENFSEGDKAMIQHTAQYSARNGKNFLIALSQREKNNPQFQFLKASSTSHKYFMSLVEGYGNVFGFGNADLSILTKYIQNRQAILSKCRAAYEYHRLKHEQTKDKKEEAETKKEKNVDWNDFELVETIMFEEDLNIKSDLVSKIQKNAVLIPKSTEEKVISEARKREILQQCHVCKMNILASEMNKHLKNCLGQKKKLQPVQSQENSVDIKKNLEGLSGRRPDIFGSVDMEIVRMEEDEEKVIWDGQAPNITRSTASVAMLNNQQRKLKEQEK